MSVRLEDHKHKGKVIKRFDNGGGLVEIPMLSVGTINTEMTSGGGDESIDVTLDVLKQLARNIEAFGRPVPIGVSPHKDFGERAGASPGFIDSAEVRGETLWGQINLTAILLFEFEQGMWAGWSVEMVKDATTATETIDGWMLTGGIFTNRPATPVNFRVAAEGELRYDKRVVSDSISLRCESPKEDTMPDPNVASLEAKLKTSEATNTALEVQRDSLKNDKVSLEQRLVETTSDMNEANDKKAESDRDLVRVQAENTTLKKRVEDTELDLTRTRVSLEAEESRGLAEKVQKLVLNAIDSGVAPAFFEGHDKDTAAWYKAKFGGMTIKQFEDWLTAMPSIKPTSPTSAGEGDSPAADGDDSLNLSAETIKALKARGLDPALATIGDTNDLKELREKQKA